MIKDELYNIYGIISFRLVDDIRKPMLLNRINPEYKYFKSSSKCINHFDIVVGELEDNTSNIELSCGKLSWSVGINNYFEKKEFRVSANKLGLRSKFAFTALKNLYVRSILMDQLLDLDSALVHSAAFSVNGKTIILAGRPGVFKTSILMDAIRCNGASFIGEENCLLSKNKVYPFSLNIDSISYKIENYKDENASGKLQKMKLGMHLLKKNTDYKNLELSVPLEIDAVFYLEKGDIFNVKPVSLEEILPSLVENELLELSMPPTHTLSGIKYNYFKETLINHDENFIANFKNKLKQIFVDNFNGKKCYKVISPKKYKVSITQEILETINNINL